METAVANLVKEGTRATVVVTGYFGDRLAQMCERYGAAVTRLDVEWGTACDPDALRAQLKATPADVVAMVHAETSTGVLNPVRELAAIAREHGALTIVDAVTSLGGMPLEVGAWGIDAAYSCTQKCLGGPSGLAPVVFGPRALEQRVKCRSFYFDLGAARGLLAAAQVSPHDVVDARLRAVRGAGDRRGRGPRRALGAARAQPSRAGRVARGARALAAAAPKPIGCGR